MSSAPELAEAILEGLGTEYLLQDSLRIEAASLVQIGSDGGVERLTAKDVEVNFPVLYSVMQAKGMPTKSMLAEALGRVDEKYCYKLSKAA
eukprot:6417336-Alexandrium_andersonii.AAC.1